MKSQLCDRSKASCGVEPNKGHTRAFLLGQLDENKTTAANDEHLLKEAALIRNAELQDITAGAAKMGSDALRTGIKVKSQY